MTRVLLYSGGMDSYILGTTWKPDVRLYVKLGHRYQERELATIRASGVDVVVDDRLWMGDLELPNAIIPLRNLYLAMLASHHGDTIALGALSGEVNADKSETFRAQTQAVLSTCYAPSYWSTCAGISVQHPLDQHTKTTAVRAYLDAGGDPGPLVLHTRSCYAATALPCGHCSACIKRHIALTLNGLSEDTVGDPHDSPYLTVMADRWETYDTTRKAETAAVFPHLAQREGTP